MRFIRAVLYALVACAIAVPAAAQRHSPTPPGAEAFYNEAVQSMRELAQPQYLTYDMVGTPDGMSISLVVENHLVWLVMPHERTSTPVTWTIRHRTDDYASEIFEADGGRLVSTRPFFDPTWYGAFRALRDGMLGYQQAERPISSFATPAPVSTPDLRTIAVVTVMGSTMYRVVDRGAATCANGDPGHAIHLVPRWHDHRHQLTDVVVDLRNMHFCTMRFTLAELGVRDTVEEHYANVGGYWLQTGGSIAAAFQPLGISLSHGKWRYRIENVAFPKAIPSESFVPPANQ